MVFCRCMRPHGALNAFCDQMKDTLMPNDMSPKDASDKQDMYLSPLDFPQRARDEMSKLMIRLTDSELAAAAAFAEVINDGPGIRERISAARIVMEKTRNAEKLMAVLAQFRPLPLRYTTAHSWTEWLDRDAGLDARRPDHDMRLIALHYPINGWVDAVVMHVLLGTAGLIQIEDLSNTRYKTMHNVLRDILAIEQRHNIQAREGLTKLLACGERDAVEASLGYWWPRISASFGRAGAEKFKLLRQFGLRLRPDMAQRKTWEAEMGQYLARMHLTVPVPL